MNPDIRKAYVNGSKRPARTSKINPIVIASTPHGEYRVSPRLAHLKANGVPAAKAAGRAEAMANYVSKDSFGMPGKADARQAAASMARQARKTKLLSRADVKAIVEFAAMDLGQDMNSSLCGPCSPAEKSKKYYPTLYVNGVKKLDLPLKGRATIEYRIRSTTDRQDESGNVSQSADIEVLSIDPETVKVAPKAGGKAVVTKTDFRRDLRSVVEFARGEQVYDLFKTAPNTPSASALRHELLKDKSKLLVAAAAKFPKLKGILKDVPSFQKSASDNALARTQAAKLIRGYRSKAF